MKILVTGGTGHVGSYLVPRLLLGGHDVRVVARNPRPQYVEHPQALWDRVQWITADRKAEEKDGSWAGRMASIEADVVMDLICYTPEQNRLMVEAFRGRVSHFLHCGTIWAYGPPRELPYEERFPRRPIREYGRLKAQIESELLAEYTAAGFPYTVIHPGHISGRKWLPIDPQGTRNGVGVYGKLARGEVVHLPDAGQATLHHVHGDDVAQLFQLAMERREQALGESFSAVTPYALSLLGCAEFVASLFGREPNIEFVPLAGMKEAIGEQAAACTEDHVKHSPCASIEKGRRLLDYRPRYTTEQIYAECVEYVLESGQLAAK
jgi:nucleoside-diphosphate-sugar epimerase